MDKKFKIQKPTKALIKKYIQIIGPSFGCYNELYSYKLIFFVTKKPLDSSRCPLSIRVLRATSNFKTRDKRFIKLFNELNNKKLVSHPEFKIEFDKIVGLFQKILLEEKEYICLKMP